MKLSPQQQFVAWIISGAVLIAVGSWCTFFPLRQGLQAKRTKILEARITTEINTRQQQNLSALKGQVDQTLKNTETLNAAFFNRSKTLEFLEFIEKLADAEKLQLAEPQLAEPARSSPDTASTYSVEEKAFHFDVSGPMTSLMRFTRALETNPAYILIHTISLQRDQADVGSLTLEGTIPWH